MKKNLIYSTLIFHCVFLACTKQETSTPTPIANSASAPQNTVTIKGVIKAKGKGTPPEVIRMSADAYCAKYWEGKKVEVKKVETGSEGGLKGAVVYVKGDLKSTPSSVPLVLDQLGCTYAPTTIALQVGQPLIIKNSDSTLHNVHAMPKTNAEFNFGMATKGQQAERRFTKAETGIRFKCDVHGWMTASVSVFDHPYFAITNEEGKFEISGVPEGNHILEVYHPALGTKSFEASSPTVEF